MSNILITGITGQAGSYLADILLSGGNQVIGMARRNSTNNLWRIEHNLNKPNFLLTYGDVTDISSIIRILKVYEIEQVYNCAAQSHVGISFDEPQHTMDVTGKGVINILEAIKLVNKDIRMLQFSTSELFGTNINDNGMQNENTLMKPQSPYAIAKLVGYNATKLYREAYNMFISNIIMFNCESPRRGEEFVTRKITKYAAELYKHIKYGDTSKLYPKLKLGNIYAKRDWGYCPDYMEAAIKIMNHTIPDDFVVATGETHSVEELLDAAFSIIGLDYNQWIYILGSLKRPAEVPILCGDSTKIKETLNWAATTQFNKLVQIMLDSDIERAIKGV